MMVKVSNTMTTEEALKAFVETCDTKGADLDEMMDAYHSLEATIRYPLSCDYALKKASQAEKLKTLVTFYSEKRDTLFVKFVNIPANETVKRAETLQEIKDLFKTLQMLLFISESDSNATQEADSQRGTKNAKSPERTAQKQND